jgi:hypothetical protein
LFAAAQHVFAQKKQGKGAADFLLNNSGYCKMMDNRRGRCAVARVIASGGRRGDECAIND